MSKDLVVNLSSPYRPFPITFDGKEVSVSEARKILAAGEYDGMNIAMQRLVSMDFDMDALREFYEDEYWH